MNGKKFGSLPESERKMIYALISDAISTNDEAFEDIEKLIDKWKSKKIFKSSFDFIPKNIVK